MEHEKKIEPYLNDRLIIRKDGYSIIFSAETIISMICPVCEFVVRTHDDEFAMNKVGACNDCMIRYAHRDMHAWNEGERPDRSEIESQVPRKLQFKTDQINIK